MWLGDLAKMGEGHGFDGLAGTWARHQQGTSLCVFTYGSEMINLRVLPGSPQRKVGWPFIGGFCPKGLDIKV